MAYRIVRPDGEIRYVHGRGDVRRDQHGGVRYAFGTTQDVTERHQAEVARQEAQELFETAFSHAPIGMALIGLDGRWLKVNRAVCTITGWPEPELLKRTFQDITHPDDLEADLAQVERLIAGKINEYQIEKRYLTRTGSEIWALLSVSLVRDAEGRPRHFISQIEDISQRKRAEERLREAEADARMQRDHATAIIGAMHEGYAFTVDGEIKAVNDALCTVTGFTRDQLVGSRPPYAFWAPELTDEMDEVRRRVTEEEGGLFEVAFMRANGERFEAELTVQPARDAAGQTIGFVSTMRDVSVQNRQHRELERLARTDSLTGLANRHVLQESLHGEARRRASDAQQLALVLLDLDLFKQINDEHGHPAGDAVLIEVARRLMLTVRSGEVLARVGGEEFAWLLPASSTSEAIAAADRARAAIASRPFAGAGPLTMSAGVGLVPTPSDGDELYRLADRALYEAKQNGRNRTCCLHGGSGDVASPRQVGDDEASLSVRSWSAGRRPPSSRPMGQIIRRRGSTGAGAGLPDRAPMRRPSCGCSRPGRGRGLACARRRFGRGGGRRADGAAPRAGPRPCDRDARRELGPRWMCVFGPPDRELLGLDFAHAREVVDRRRAADPPADHPVMTHQTINIAPKIAEADRVLRADPGRQEWLLEVHPELSFQALAGATPRACASGSSSDGTAAAATRGHVGTCSGPSAWHPQHGDHERHRHRSGHADDHHPHRLGEVDAHGVHGPAGRRAARGARARSGRARARAGDRMRDLAGHGLGDVVGGARQGLLHLGRGRGDQQRPQHRQAQAAAEVADGLGHAGHRPIGVGGGAVERVGAHGAERQPMPAPAIARYGHCLANDSASSLLAHR